MRRLGRVVQSLIKVSQDKREFAFEFCNFVQRFSIYIVRPSVFWVWIISDYWVSVNRLPNNPSLVSTIQSQVSFWSNCVSVYYLSGYAHKCSDIVVDACKGIPGYTKTVVSEELQRKYSGWIKNKINYDSVKDNCSQPRKEIICAENLPACVDSTAAFLCRDNCLKFFNTCTSPFFYGKDMCMEFPKGGDTPKDSAICKQNHWPRTENWKLSEKPTKGKAGLILS